MFEKLACKMGRQDEEPNIMLAEELAANEDHEGIKEIVEGMEGKDKAIANDCIKVLYEIGERKPELISEYVMDFMKLLLSKNNRLVWGSMTALAQIAELKSRTIFEHIEVVKAAYEGGSVITRDQSITVFAKLCKADKNCEKELFPFLLEHIRHCRPKEATQHAERMSLCVTPDNKDAFIQVLEERKPQVTQAQASRLNRLIKTIK